MFVDRVTINVHSGKGGDGAVSFRREKLIPRGGPDGGDGGDGGSVIIVAQPGVDSLAMLAQKRHWTAQAGEKGRGANCFGRKGEDITLPVPPGTIVYDSRGFVLKDLAHPGDTLIAAKGGKGGKGNTNFKTSTNRAPRQSTPGEDAEVRELVLELKVIADVGLIGLPNAGKSTLLSRLSRARPEIADYPFTTKFPNLGIVNVGPDRQFVLADIPGLIEGAHAGVGLGHEFLRHILRCRILLFVVDTAGSEARDPVNDLTILRTEISHYDKDLAKRPWLILANKMDLPDAPEKLAQIKARFPKVKVIPVSAHDGSGLDDLKKELLKRVHGAGKKS